MLLHINQGKFLPGIEETREITSQDAGYKLQTVSTSLHCHAAAFY